jgi:6-pyruvoyltetrahydropterin/6-carboxytetrahydropterin synthase
MPKFQSTKIFDGFSTVFRQWKAEGTHCKFLHGYGVSFKVWFEGDLDEKNWVWDFGGMKRAKGTIDGKNPKEWMDYMFDHTTLIAEDDPFLNAFIEMGNAGAAQIRILPSVGAEQFAKYIFEKLDIFVQEETNSRVKVIRVEFAEHNKNTAVYEL